MGPDHLEPTNNALNNKINDPQRINTNVMWMNLEAEECKFLLVCNLITTEVAVSVAWSWSLHSYSCVSQRCEEREKLKATCFFGQAIFTVLLEKHQESYSPQHALYAANPERRKKPSNSASILSPNYSSLFIFLTLYTAVACRRAGRILKETIARILRWSLLGWEEEGDDRLEKRW